MTKMNNEQLAALMQKEREAIAAQQQELKEYDEQTFDIPLNRIEADIILFAIITEMHQFRNNIEELNAAIAKGSKRATTFAVQVRALQWQVDKLENLYERIKNKVS